MAGVVDPNTIHDPSTGTVPPDDWGDAVRNYLVGLGGDSASGNGKPMCRVYYLSNTSVATATFTALSFFSERYDVGGCHSTASNQSRLTVPTDWGGVYHIGGCVQFDANATGIREARIRLNGSTYIAASTDSAVSASGDHTINVSCDYKLSAGDYVELMAFQTSGGLLNVLTNGNFSPEFWWSWQGIG